MTLKTTAALVTIAAVLPASASAQLERVPRKAKRMTQELAYNATWNKLMAELRDSAKWPHGIVPAIDEPCRVTRLRGVCDYEITGGVLDDRGFYTATKRCTGSVTVKIAKRTKRVTSRKDQAGCAVD